MSKGGFPAMQQTACGYPLHSGSSVLVLVVFWYLTGSLGLKLFGENTGKTGDTIGE